MGKGEAKFKYYAKYLIGFAKRLKENPEFSDEKIKHEIKVMQSLETKGERFAKRSKAEEYDERIEKVFKALVSLIKFMKSKRTTLLEHFDVTPKKYDRLLSLLEQLEGKLYVATESASKLSAKDLEVVHDVISSLHSRMKKREDINFAKEIRLFYGLPSLTFQL